MRRPTHHGGATSSRFYDVWWKGYRSRIQTTKTPSVVCFFPFTTLDTGTVKPITCVADRPPRPPSEPSGKFWNYTL